MAKWLLPSFTLLACPAGGKLENALLPLTPTGLLTMTDLGLRPRKATELVDAAFQLYRREPLQFIIGFGVVYIPWMVISGALGFQPSDVDPTLKQTVVSLTGGLLVYALASGVSTVLANDIYFNRPTDLACAFPTIGASFLSLVLTMFVVALAVGFGLALLVIPGFYMLARYFAVRQAVLLEGAAAGAALRRTSELSKGYKKHIVLTIIIVSLLTFALSMGVGLFLRVIPSLMVRSALSAIFATLIYPLFGITETLLYYDIRIRKEGFDIEYLSTAPAETSVVTT